MIGCFPTVLKHLENHDFALDSDVREMRYGKGATAAKSGLCDLKYTLFSGLILITLPTKLVDAGLSGGSS